MAADSRLVAPGDGPTCTIKVAGIEYVAREWCIDDDVLQLGDACSFDVPNIDLATGRAGALSGKIQLGQQLEVFTADPQVAGGQPVRQLVGRVTKIKHSSDDRGGSVIRVTGADLGSHLTQTCGPPFLGLEGATMAAFLDKVIDPGWGITGLRDNKLLGKRLKQGRAGVEHYYRETTGKVTPVMAPIQVQPGELIAEILIRYARRDLRLVNVAPDGALEIFTPRQTADPTEDPIWRLEYHGDGERVRNNILDAPTIDEDVSSVYSEVRCFSTRVIPVQLRPTDNPNDNYSWATYRPTANPLPYERLLVFSEPDAISDEMRLARAKWRWQRGMFDAWRYTAAVRGHSQGGAFITADTIASVNDTFHKVQGQFYVRAVRRSFTMRGGYRAELTLHKLGLLGA